MRVSARPALRAPEAPVPAMFLRSISSSLVSAAALANPCLRYPLSRRKGRTWQLATEIPGPGWTNGRRGCSSRGSISASWWTSSSARWRPASSWTRTCLARRYGGGLAGIREALARLALEGLVVRRARVGTSVAPLDLAGAREAFEARCLIEVHCAGPGRPACQRRRDRRHPRHPGRRRGGGARR